MTSHNRALFPSTGAMVGYRNGYDYRRALRRHFSSRRFYLTPQGLVFFYQPGCAAPANQGPLTFLVPYSEKGPHLPHKAESHGIE